MAVFSCQLFILIAFFAGVHERVQGGSLERIVGGQQTDTNQYSYTVSVRTFSGEHHCNGIVVGSRWALTTKKCIGDDVIATMVTIRGGSNDLSGDSTTFEPYECENIVPHNTADIVLLRVVEEFSTNIGVAELPVQDEDLPTAAIVTAVGYGNTLAASGPYSLRSHVSKRVMTRLICEAYTNQREAEGYFCTIANAFRGLCIDDGGAPLVYGNTVIGMATDIHLSCGDGYPEVYIKLSMYRDWIIENMVENQ